MAKNLRFVLVSMFMLLCGSAFAEDIIWQEDWSSVTEFKVDPSTFNANYTFTGTVLNDDNSFKSGTTFYNEKIAGGEAPELLVAKNGGSFAAKVNLNGKSGDMVLSFLTNKALTISVEGATLGEETTSGNSHQYPVTVASGTSEITITFSNTTKSNARLDNIKLYQGTAKKPAGLSWGKASTTLTIGQEVTLALQNENNLDVTFTSSDEAVATISTEGVITLVAAGKTTLTAAFAGNDEYEAQSVSIEVTVKAAEGEGTGEETGGDTGTTTTTEPITVAKALEIINALEDGKTTTETYQVKGYVISVTEISSQYNNATFVIADAATDTEGLTVFRCKGFNGEDITDMEIVKQGDVVVIEGKLQKYVKNETMTPEVAQGGKIISINGETGSDTPAPTVELVTVTKALEIINALEDGKTTVETYQVKGYIIGAPTFDRKEDNSLYGNVNLLLADETNGTNTLTVFRGKCFNGDSFTEETISLIKEGDEVVFEGKLQKYVKNEVTTPELTNGKLISVNGQTGITTIKLDAENTAIYNLNGQRVVKAQKGLYIIGGKKVMMK